MTIMTSIWDSTLTDEGAQSVAFYRGRQNNDEVDIGDILATARNTLPYIIPDALEFYRGLGRGSSFQVNRELYR